MRSNTKECTGNGQPDRWCAIQALTRNSTDIVDKVLHDLSSCTVERV